MARPGGGTGHRSRALLLIETADGPDRDTTLRTAMLLLTRLIDWPLKAVLAHRAPSVGRGRAETPWRVRLRGALAHHDGAYEPVSGVNRGRVGAPGAGGAAIRVAELTELREAPATSPTENHQPGSRLRGVGGSGRAARAAPRPVLAVHVTDAEAGTSRPCCADRGQNRTAPPSCFAVNGRESACRS